MFKINEVVASGTVADVIRKSDEIFEIFLTSGVVANVGSSEIPKTIKQGSQVTLFGKLAMSKTGTLFAVHEVLEEKQCADSVLTEAVVKDQPVSQAKTREANVDTKISRVASSIANKVNSKIQTKIPDLPRVEIPEDTATGFDAKPSLTAPENSSRAVKPLKMEPPVEINQELQDLAPPVSATGPLTRTPAATNSSPKGVLPILTKLTAEKPEDPTKMVKLGPPPFAMESATCTDQKEDPTNTSSTSNRVSAISPKSSRPLVSSTPPSGLGVSSKSTAAVASTVSTSRINTNALGRPIVRAVAKTQRAQVDHDATPLLTKDVSAALVANQQSMPKRSTCVKVASRG